MKSLKPRLLTAGVGIPLILVVLYLCELWNPLITIVVGVVSAFMIGEYLGAKGLLKHYPLSVSCMLFSFALPLVLMTAYIYALLVAFMIIVFSVMIASHKKISYIDLVYALSGTLLISFGMSSLSLICRNSASITFFFITVFALPWMADAGGFFVGATLGKHKLCPEISPKKTVEGAIGGVVFCIASALIIGLIFQNLILPDMKINFWALALLGAIDAPVSILGDLSFSLIKRSLNIKDYGSIFPGHGGMLDRFDSIIFTAPIIVIINQFLPFLS